MQQNQITEKRISYAAEEKISQLIISSYSLQQSLIDVI